MKYSFVVTFLSEKLIRWKGALLIPGYVYNRKVFYFFIFFFSGIYRTAEKQQLGDRYSGGGDRRDVVPDSAFTVFRARVNAHLARAPTAL